MKPGNCLRLAILILGMHRAVFAADAPPPPPPALAEAQKLLAAVKPPPVKQIPPVEYYLSVDDKVTGPFLCAKILEMAKMRQVTPETKVWKAGLDNWRRAASFEELKAIFALVPPPVNSDWPHAEEVRFDKVPLACPPPDDGKAPWWWPLPFWPF